MKVCISVVLALFAALAAAESTPPPALGYGDLGYALPPPGSYALPPLGQAADGRVLDSAGHELRLHELYGDRIVLLSFIYASCSDVNGCPLATAVFHRIAGRLAQEPELAGRLRLITLSFNPEHDTPEAMAHYGASVGQGLDWRFLTTRSEADVAPILAAYGQSVQKDVDAVGQFLGTYSHVLRVYLIDRERRIRNIYTVSFLHPDTLINDVRTLLLETAAPLRTGGAGAPSGTAAPSAGGAGGSESLASRTGRPADLLAYALRPPLGLPKLPVPSDNALRPERIALGRKLFFDRRLSLNNTVSCGMCHVPEQGFANNEQATAVGIEGRSVRRNTPTLYNVGYLARLFHDGREDRLEQQVWGPLLAHNEMAAPSVGYVVTKLKHLPDYAGLFERAYGRGPSMETIGAALASYERTLNSADSPFDRWRFGGRGDALTAAQEGFALFTGKAGCADCHRLDRSSALFTDQDLHNTGVGYRATMGDSGARRRVQAAPGVEFELDPTALAAVSEPKAPDLGLYEITQNPADRWKYRTPGLRNVALTAPYMHDGSLATLKDVVRFYNAGGVPNENLDPRIRPLGLTETEMDALVAFLESLTGSNAAILVGDAHAAPVGDPR